MFDDVRDLLTTVDTAYAEALHQRQGMETDLDVLTDPQE